MTNLYFHVGTGRRNVPVPYDSDFIRKPSSAECGNVTKTGKHHAIFHAVNRSVWRPSATAKHPDMHYTLPAVKGFVNKETALGAAPRPFVLVTSFRSAWLAILSAKSRDLAFWDKDHVRKPEGL